RLLEDGTQAHFMTRRFDRVSGQKIHTATFCGLAHEDRNPAGNTHYETLFGVARRLGLGQPALDQLVRRMVFNVLARNQDDHSKNHAFLMDANGTWVQSPAYDLIFSFQPNSRWIAQQQMRVGGKRDGFTLADLESAARAADVKRPAAIIADVRAALSRWPKFARESGLEHAQAKAIAQHFRKL